MSMGNIESFHQIVPEKTLITVVGKALVNKWHEAKDAITNSLGICDSTLADYLNGEGNDIDADSKEWIAFEKVHNRLLSKFKEKTGLDLVPMYTDGDGDCYDDLEAETWYWELDISDVWVRKMTPTASKFIKTYGNDAINTDCRFSRYG